jgi:hypothetical protein
VLRRWLPSAAIFLVAAAVTSVFFINFCATVFHCGCQSLWTTADKYCNIHAAHGKHCPWCVFGYTGYAGVFGSMLAAEAAVAFGGVRLGWHWLVRLFGALAAFPVTGSILAVALGLYTGYWD